VHDCSTGPIWNGAASGFINNVPYSVDGVAHTPPTKRQEGRLMFTDYHFFLSSRQQQIVDFTLITPEGAKLDGMTMTIGLHGNGSDAAPGARNVQNWAVSDKPHNFKVMYFAVSDATMQIVFGKHSGANLPVQIHFCIPSKRTEVAGHFTANMAVSMTSTD
jgi:hypothetical protein